MLWLLLLVSLLLEWLLLLNWLLKWCRCDNIDLVIRYQHMLLSSIPPSSHNGVGLSFFLLLEVWVQLLSSAWSISNTWQLSLFHVAFYHFSSGDYVGEWWKARFNHLFHVLDYNIPMNISIILVSNNSGWILAASYLKRLGVLLERFIIVLCHILQLSTVWCKISVILTMLEESFNDMSQRLDLTPF